MVLTIDKEIPELDLYKNITINKSYNKINLIGACEKSMVSIFKPYGAEILEIKGTDYKDIVTWIMKMYNHILERF